MACLFHKWDGCKCSKCGKLRDEGHNWDFCHGKCVICGKTCNSEHLWKTVSGKYVEVCDKCGTKRATSHDWKGNYKDLPDEPKDLKEIFSPEELGKGSVFRFYRTDTPKWAEEWCRVIDIDYSKEFVSYTPCSYRSPQGSAFGSLFSGTLYRSFIPIEPRW